VSERAIELNLDGIVGPTHSYAGLSYGNVASMGHDGAVANPRAAALQGLAKMKAVADLGVEQAVLPPHERPDVFALGGLGFAGPEPAVLERVSREAPELLAMCASASAMWAANAATVSPSADTDDHRVHFTPANLTHFAHRSLEAPTTAAVLRAIFGDERRFAHHEPLPSTAAFGDEGAANHTRLCAEHGGPGLEVFTYGRDDTADDRVPLRYPARQSAAASRATARLHELRADATVFVRQHPAAVDAGVFHNDVAAVGNLDVLLFHEQAFAGHEAVLVEITDRLVAVAGVQPALLEVPSARLSLADAVSTYLFNSQLLSLPSGSMVLLCPGECEQHAAAAGVIDELVANAGPIERAVYVDVRQSMKNGGGPACLRLRVVLTDDELAAMHTGVRFSDELHAALCGWVERHYRDRLSPGDLADPALLVESRAALDELTGLLGLPAIYPFQR